MGLKISFLAALLAVARGDASAAEPAALDAGVYAGFTMSQTTVSFQVCGVIDGTSGCFGSAALSPPFDYACAVLQGKPKTSGNTITRAVYVLDKRTGSNSHVMLYVYERKDVIGTGSDSVSAKLKTTVDLNITGGSGAHCMLAGSKKYVYASTDASSEVVIVTMSNNSIYGIVEGGQPLSITADDRGYVAMQFAGGYEVDSPYGDPWQIGGGTVALINQRNGWIQN